MRSLNKKSEFRKPLSRSANERISDGHVLRLAYGDANFRARCVISLKIHGNYRSCIYSVATVIQREREALTNMAAAGGLANALSFL